MGSRILNKPDSLFEVFLVMKKENFEASCNIIYKFPIDYNNEQILKSAPKFLFPYAEKFKRIATEKFTFVFTDIDGRFKFGSCRLYADKDECLCFITFLPWLDFFYEQLDKMAYNLENNNNLLSSSILSQLYKLNNFDYDSNAVLHIDDNDIFNVRFPSLQSLDLYENKYLFEIFKCLDPENLCYLFANILLERRILLSSSKLSRLSHCVLAASHFIYPMFWQHLFIPILPTNLLDYCSAPMPYLIGVHSSTMKLLKPNEYADAVLVNLDTNTIESSHDDLSSLPPNVISNLKRKIKHFIVDKTKANTKPFLRAMVSLIGGYRDALRFPQGSNITFCAESFVKTRSSDYQPLLNKMLHMQTFHQFIEDRLDMLNNGKGFSDAFELEVNEVNDRWNAQSRYKDWVGNMMRHGRKLKNKGKDKWSVFSHKVKVKSKDILKHEPEDERDGAVLRIGLHQLYPPPRPPPPKLLKPVIKKNLVRTLSSENLSKYTQISHSSDLPSFKIQPMEKSQDALSDSNETDFSIIKSISYGDFNLLGLDGKDEYYESNSDYGSTYSSDMVIPKSEDVALPNKYNSSFYFDDIKDLVYEGSFSTPPLFESFRISPTNTNLIEPSNISIESVDFMSSNPPVIPPIRPRPIPVKSLSKIDAEQFLNTSQNIEQNSHLLDQQVKNIFIDNKINNDIFKPFDPFVAHNDKLNLNSQNILDCNSKSDVNAFFMENNKIESSDSLKIKNNFLPLCLQADNKNIISKNNPISHNMILKKNVLDEQVQPIQNNLSNAKPIPAKRSSKHYANFAEFDPLLSGENTPEINLKNEDDLLRSWSLYDCLPSNRNLIEPKNQLLDNWKPFQNQQGFNVNTLEKRS